MPPPGQISLTWVAPTTMGDGSAASGITGYNLYRSTTPYDIAPALVASVGLVLATTLTAVPPGVWYVWVSAITATGESPLELAFNGDGVTGTPYWTI
jgi:hypothetical protein